MPEWFRTLLLALFLSCPAVAAWAEVEPVGDPAVEARVRAIGEELRCLTCMGQSIADSNAGFSEDMRREIRAMVRAGKSDREIIDFMVARYGDFVLYRPPLKESTWLLWAGPFLLLALAMVVLVRTIRRRAKSQGLAAEEGEES